MIQGFELNQSSWWAFAWSMLPILLIGLRTTIAAMATGYIVALVFGLIFALIRKVQWKPVAWLMGAVIECLRNTPLLMQLFFLYFVLPDYGLILPAFWTGVMAIGLQYAAYMSEMYRAGLDAIPKGQWEAAKSLNLRSTTLYLKIIFPQVIPRILPTMGNNLVSMMKETPILSTITVVEILNLANRIGDRTFEYFVPLSMVGAIFLLLTTACTALLRFVERRVPQKGWSLK